MKTIKTRGDRVLFESNRNVEVKYIVEEAVRKGVNLFGVDLHGEDLSGVNLEGANLWGANLRNANLSCTDLSYAKIKYANLSNANLTNANLTHARLDYADLVGATYRLIRHDYTSFVGVIGLPLGKVLQISSGIEPILALSPADVRVGILGYSIDFWLKYIDRIGKHYQYTDEMISEYREHLQHVERWFELRKKNKRRG